MKIHEGGTYDLGNGIVCEVLAVGQYREHESICVFYKGDFLFFTVEAWLEFFPDARLLKKLKYSLPEIRGLGWLNGLHYCELRKIANELIVTITDEGAKPWLGKAAYTN